MQVTDIQTLARPHSPLSEQSLVDLILVGMIVSPDAGSFLTSMYGLFITIGIAVGVGPGSGPRWWLWSRFTEELLVDLILVGVIMGANSGSCAFTGVALNLIAILVCVGGGVAPAGLAEEPLVHFSFVAVIVRSDTGGRITIPFLDLVAILVD